MKHRRQPAAEPAQVAYRGYLVARSYFVQAGGYWVEKGNHTIARGLESAEAAKRVIDHLLDGGRG